MNDAESLNAQGKKLNCREACAILGCSRSQFYRLIHKGKLCAFRVKGCKRGIRVLEQECLALVEAVSSD